MCVCNSILMQVLYGESPANPTMTILDLEVFGALGKMMGIDLSIHSW